MFMKTYWQISQGCSCCIDGTYIKFGWGGTEVQIHGTILCDLFTESINTLCIFLPISYSIGLSSNIS